ncbi:ABC transporter substrate-binding protein [Bosea sp. BIWAKO-01]|uniref:ABC transporter substrate-binding protein n=1 Tax=Bosea sp. BIWAKO-01 TaxID=506668 RepID=UPI00086AC420|nr:ABC transporter substrate-binding protein [Bosea sp. BIWAKO-01]GAU86790.1 dipeptide-binding ABC transporter periplasmic substrate-binding component [Bosea sp. BIWAKO-01]
MTLSRRNLLQIAAAAAASGSLSAPAAAQTKSINIGLSSAAAMLDLVRTSSGPDFEVVRQIFDTLLTRNEETGEFTPNLATSWRLVDDVTWQFKLREGVTFHNGEPFNAEAVAFSVMRYLKPELKSPHAGVLSFIEKVDVIDASTVNIVTKKPYPVFLVHMAVGSTGMIIIMPPKYIAEKGDDNFAKNPVGTGPYRFIRAVPGSSITLESNEAYWRGKPAITQVNYRFVPENSTRVSALIAGDLDIIENVPTDLIGLIEKSGKAKVAVSETSGLCLMMQLNPASHPALANKQVRKAMNHAVDIDTILKSLLGGRVNRRALPVYPGAVAAKKDLPLYKYDPALAKKMLADAGYAKGFELDAFTSNGRYAADYAIAQAYVEYLGEVGIKVNLRPMEWATLVGNMAKRQAGPMYQIGWSFREGDVFKLKAALHPASPYSTFQNAEFGALIDQAEVTMVPEKRAELWGKAQELLLDEAPFIHAWQPFDLYGAANRVAWKQPIVPMFIFDMDLK